MAIEYAWRVVARALREGAFAEQLTQDADTAVAQLRLMFPRATDAELTATLSETLISLSVYQKLRTAAREEEHGQIREMSNEFRKGLVDVIHQIEAGYNGVMTMYTIAFYVGIALILLAVVASLVLKENVVALIFGGLGMADIITAFVFRPAQELQNSRGNLTQLQAAFFNWANDVRNWNAFLERLDLSVKPGELPPYEAFERVSLRSLNNTAEMMRLVDEYCEMTTHRVGETAQKSAADGPGAAETKASAEKPLASLAKSIQTISSGDTVHG